MSRNRFAEVMGIQPSGLSHLLSGRNNPGYDFIVKLIARFPEINPYWLLGDSDRMLNDSTAGAEGVPESKTGALEALDKPRSGSIIPTGGSDPARKYAQTVRNDSGKEAPGAENLGAIVETMANISPVERVVIFFTDKTFEVFTPRKKNF